MGWASGMRAGTDMARGWIDTYETARERRELDRVADAKPEEITGYSDTSAAQLREIASTKDAQGNLAYQLEAKPDGSYGLRVRGEDGNYTPVDGPGIQQRQTTAFLGNRYDGQLDEARMGGLRQNAYADVVSRRDPIKGMQMRRQAKTDEREDTRWAQELEDRPMKQRAAALQLGGLERAERTAVGEEAWNTQFGQMVASYTGSPEQLDKAIPMVNNTSKALTLGQPDPKTGLMPLSVVTADGKGLFLQLPQHEQAQIFAAASTLKTNPQRALAVLSGINKELAAVVAKENQLTKFLADGNNDVAYKGNQLANDQERTRNQRDYQNRSLGLQAQQARMGRIEQVIDPTTGKATFAELSMQGGQPTLRPVNMNGMGLAPRSVDPAKLASTVESLVAAGMTLPQARIAADEMFGMNRPAPAAADKSLQEQNAARGAPGATSPSPIAPTVTQYNRNAFENFISGARQGDPTSVAIVKGWLQTNQLTAGERQLATQIIGRQ